MRISKNAFTNLAGSMIGFGVAIGIAFPFAVLGVGVRWSVAMSPLFFAFTITAGILVGGFNILLAAYLVRPRLRLMAQRMGEVEEGLKQATYSGDWTRCDPDECSLPVESDDEFGEAAESFNRLLHALAESHQVEMRIAEFTSAMSAQLDVSSICRAAIETFRRDLGAAGVAILGDENGELSILASHGINDPSTLVDSDLVRSAVRSLQPDEMEIPDHLVIDAAVARLQAQRVVVYPLVIETTAVGAVVLACSEQAPATATALGPLLIRTLSVALSNALSHENIRRIASIDGLTGVLNRREGLELLDREFDLAARRGTPLGVVMADIAHFKAVNDEHGHLAGDAVLRTVAAAVSGVLRKNDFLIRYGGEEFLAVLPGAGAGVIATIAERIREAVEDQVVRADGTGVTVTLSAGYSTTDDQPARTAMALVSRADEALFAAKEAGRNRAVSALALIA